MARLRPFSIRLRLLGIIALALLPMLGLLIHGAEQTRVHELELAAAGLRQAADLVAAQEAQVVESARQLLTAMSAAPEVRAAGVAACASYVGRIKAAYQRYEVITRYSTASEENCGIAALPAGLRIAFRDLVPQALQLERVVVGPYTIVDDQNVSKLAVLPIAYPVHDGAGRAVGVLVSALRLAWWGASLTEAHRGEKVIVRLFGPAGALLASHPRRDDVLGARPPWWSATDRVAGLFESDGELLARSAIGMAGLTVTVSRSRAEILKESDQLFWFQLRVGLLLLVAGAAAAWILGEWAVAAQVRNLTAFVHRLEAGDLAARPATSPRSGAFGQLEQALDRMADTFETKVIDLSSREARFRHEALHDALTGLPNRRALAETISLWTDEAQGAASCGSIALLLIDLDHFKPVNDTLGHDVGDAVLIAVSRRLLRWVCATDLVVRLGGDEFAIAMRAAPADVEALARRIVHDLSKPLRVHDRQIQIGASIGIAFIGRGRHSGIGAILKQADTALYEAKRGGRGRFQMPIALAPPASPAFEQAALA